MEKSARIRLIYAIFLSVFTVAVGIALICVAADIYYSGKGGDVIYSREIVSARLEWFAVPLVLLIAAIAFGAVFPLYEVRASRAPEVTVNHLRKRTPALGEDEEFSAAQKAYKKLLITRLVAWLVAVAVALASAIVVLVYVADTAHFKGDANSDIFTMVKNILPWLAAAFAALIAAAVVSLFAAKKQTEQLKTMIKKGDRTSPAVASKSNPFLAILAKAELALNRPAAIWAVRGVLLVLGVTFIIVGALNGGAHDVLVKAVNICTECIGLG